MIKNAFFALLLTLLFQTVGISQSINHWETVVFNNDTWRYFVGLSEPPSNWRDATFSDTQWNSGLGGFGLGDADDNTIITLTTSVYLRTKFKVIDTSKIVAAVLHMDYDDGFVAYLNGIEIARVGISGLHPAYNALANNHEAIMYQGKKPESFVINKDKLNLCLKNDTNIFAIQVHNTTAVSTDLSSNAYFSLGISDAVKNYRTVPTWFNAPVILSTSNLPIVSITTPPGINIMDEPKITADMKVIYWGPINNVTDPGNVYTGKVGIEIRGSYSASLPQKPYGFETRDSAGVNLNIKMLDMSKDDDWVLLANYNDKAFLRNTLPFHLFRDMGHYAPRMRYCEVQVNSDYQGIYLLGEKIKQHDKRVDIATLDIDDNAGDSVTGGYIFKNDYYTSTDSWISNFSPVNKAGASVYFAYHDPKAEDITVEQKAYIKSYINSLETVLYSADFKNPITGYRAYLDVPSFIDYWILSELSRNIDAYKKSRYYYKDKDSKDKKVYSGPTWDYDWAWKNNNDGCYLFNKTDGSGWAYRINECNPSPVPPSWEVRMLQDTTFANELNSRYFSLRQNILSETQIFHYIDSVAGLLSQAQSRHYTKWPILGINVGTPELDAQPTTYAGEVQKFKTWISTRLKWLDANMLGRKNTSVYVKEAEAICRIFPNPVSDILYVESDQIIKTIEITTLSGFIIDKNIPQNKSSVQIPISKLPNGIYTVNATLQNGQMITSKIVKK